jgi:hypothetical protein
MTSVNATTATSTTPTTSTTTAPSSTAATPKKSFDALFAEAKDDLKKGEKLTKVDGHQFGRIKGGERDEMCVNLSGNARSGQAFDLIWRDGRQFHVYGSGKDRSVVEVGHKAAPTTTPDATSKDSTPAAAKDTNAATDTSTSGATSTTGTSKTTNTAAASTGGATAA